jgi:hypothetical protein
MGSRSDWETMRHAAERSIARRAVRDGGRSAHRTPDKLFAYASVGRERGLQVIIAGAGGAASPAGMTSSKTLLPGAGVPVESKTLQGLDSAALDRTDARRRSRGDARDRPGGARQRGAPRRRDRRSGTTGVATRSGGVSGGADGAVLAAPDPAA